MKKTLAILLLAGISGILGCVGTKIEYSKPKNIIGIVTKKEYFRWPDLNLENNINSTGNNSKFNNSNQNEEFRVFIKTDVKNYIIANEYLYNQLKRGQKVDVSYKEVYKIVYKDINKDGKKELVKKNLIDFKFLNAQSK